MTPCALRRGPGLVSSKVIPIAVLRGSEGRIEQARVNKNGGKIPQIVLHHATADGRLSCNYDETVLHDDRIPTPCFVIGNRLKCEV